MSCTAIHYESILLAEDNADHALLIQCAMHKAGLLNPLVVVPDGFEAIAYLEGVGQYANRLVYPLPSLLLLDLMMPNKDGLEVLAWVKQQARFASLPVVVLATADQMHAMDRAYEIGADSFLVKPVSFRDFVQLGRTVRGFWAWFGQVPPGAAILPRDMPLFTEP